MCENQLAGDLTQTATYRNIAPELLHHLRWPNYDEDWFNNQKAADIWAVGGIVYRLTTGIVPFLPGPSLQKFCEGGPFPPQLPGLSELGYQFVRELLVARPSERLTASAALDHVWIKGGK